MSGLSKKFKALAPDAKIRQKAQILMRAGDYAAAAALLRGAADGDRRAALLLGLCYANQSKYADARTVLEAAARKNPDDIAIAENLAVFYIFDKQPKQAIAAAESVIARAPENLHMHDVLANAYGQLGEMERAREHGERALEFKDAAARGLNDEIFTLPPEPAPAPGNDPRANVISFSLFGDKPRYVANMIVNARIAPHIYPGWSVRVYCDETVPIAARRELMTLGADLRMRRRAAPYEGLFWRFEAMNDPAGGRFLVRDCDSILNVKERVAVDQWLESGKYFHVMRDNYTHCGLIMAGMWGGSSGVLPPLAKLRAAFKPRHMETSQLDQWFLGDVVWPLIKPSCLIHDSFFRSFGAVPFPKLGQLPKGQHVGMSYLKPFRPKRTAQFKVTVKPLARKRPPVTAAPRPPGAKKD